MKTTNSSIFSLEKCEHVISLNKYRPLPLHGIGISKGALA